METLPALAFAAVIGLLVMLITLVALLLFGVRAIGHRSTASGRRASPLGVGGQPDPTRR